MTPLHAIAILGTVLAAALPASAHEFWIRPSRFVMQAGQPSKVYLLNGHDDHHDVVPRNTPYIERYEMLLGGDVLPVGGRHGRLESMVRPAEQGTGIIVYQSREVESVLPPERFLAYLQEQHLEWAVELRAELGEADQPGREVYVRCAKSLVSVGEEAGVLIDRVAGLPYEIVLDAAGQDGPMTLRVFYEGRPAVHARIVATSERTPTRRIELRTDDQGRATLPETLEGSWRFTSLHMTRVDDRDAIQWKSYWASLTASLGE
ncbi:MAG: DUF4198 domain-containing protein [Planctomycetota bacterium]